jgi:hypothetical protein
VCTKTVYPILENLWHGRQTQMWTLSSVLFHHHHHRSNVGAVCKRGHYIWKAAWHSGSLEEEVVGRVSFERTEKIYWSWVVSLFSVKRSRSWIKWKTVCDAEPSKDGGCRVHTLHLQELVLRHGDVTIGPIILWYVVIQVEQWTSLLHPPDSAL